jgi:hypothetical protein
MEQRKDNILNPSSLNGLSTAKSRNGSIIKKLENNNALYSSDKNLGNKLITPKNDILKENMKQERNKLFAQINYGLVTSKAGAK